MYMIELALYMYVQLIGTIRSELFILEVVRGLLKFGLFSLI